MSLGPAEIDVLYRRHAPTVFRRARQILRTDAEAHEVVQDLFVGLLERPGQLREKHSVSAWFYSATTHACLNRLRDVRTRARLLTEQGPPQEADSAAPPDALALVRAALVALPPPLGEVAVYTFIDGMTQEEIAPLIGCSRRQVSALIERVRAWGQAQEAV